MRLRQICIDEAIQGTVTVYTTRKKTRNCWRKEIEEYSLVQKIIGKIKGHKLDIAPISEGTSLQKRSGMARVVEGFHSFVCSVLTHACIK